MKRVCQLVGICQSTDSRCHNIYKFLQIVITTDAVAVFYVAQISFFKQRLQIFCFLVIRLTHQHLRQTSIEHIFVEPGLNRPSICRHKFLETKRIHLHLISTSTKFRNDVLRQKFSIAACHVDIHITHPQEAIEHVLKMVEHLHFIKHHIVSAIVNNPAFNILIQIVRIAQ